MLCQNKSILKSKVLTFNPDQCDRIILIKNRPEITLTLEVLIPADATNNGILRL